MAATNRAAEHASSSQPGRVVANYGKRLLVEDAAGVRHPCRPKGRRLRAVCGDRVRWTAGAGDEPGVVTGIEPRTTELTRPDQRGRTEVLAANVTLVAAVMAPRPAPDPFLVDRYLAAAALMGARGFLVINKTDLLDDAERDELAALETQFAAAGYDVVRCSAKSGDGVDALADKLVGETGILVGHSGVGKSSLYNRLVPDHDAATAALSAATGEGRHTTTASVLHRLPGGGELIDSPGVRDYAPADVEPRRVADGFAEFGRHAAQCRFTDCMHLKEPGCGVKTAVGNGDIAQRRYESYRRLVRLMERLAPRY